MGIPRFYRWLSERYPLINENITAEQIPEFDNLYLDMNGIIHNCSHNNTGGLCVSEEDDVFVDAFKYITRLFQLIKPRKLLYMAVDGCAPRAKMNQQRSRRFRAANDALEAREKAEARGEVIEGKQFDSNCITPGTEFMARLTEHLRFFVAKRIVEDPLWQGPTIVVSGADVPGEGEHKIMEYIRAVRAQDDYNHNTRHCVYGLDADLIMLSLVSHEPHFALLREEVVFGRQQTETAEQRQLQKRRFQLLHVSLLREYLACEFAGLCKGSAGAAASAAASAAAASAAASTNGSGSYSSGDMERVIDDLVLFCVLVGNDFLPHLPFAEIGEGGLEDFFNAYKQHLESTPEGESPWLTADCGTIVWEQFARFLKGYAEVEEDKLQSAVDDQTFLLGRRRSVGHKAADAEEQTSQPKLPEPPDSIEVAREQWYEVKFEMDTKRHEGLARQQHLFQSYLEGLQWVLYYYYRGPDGASWSWYYPYYHAPMTADLVMYGRLCNPDIRFEVGAPFRPFQQLMAVLPSNSKVLLPLCYQDLFVSPESPIRHFYPTRFDIDIDGVRVPWGGVTLIPWIEPAALVEAMVMAEREGQPLTEAEVQRNCFTKTPKGLRFDPQVSNTLSSCMPRRFGDLVDCHVVVEDFHHPALPAGVLGFDSSLLPKFDPRAPGFPTLKWYSYTHSLDSGIKVFQQDARGKGLILNLQPPGPTVPSKEELEKLLQAPSAEIDYPYAHCGKIVSIHTIKGEMRPNGTRVIGSPLDHENWVRQIQWQLRQRGLTIDFDQDEPGEKATKGKKGPIRESLQQPVAEVRPAEYSYVDEDGKVQYKLRETSEYRLLPLVRPESVQQMRLRKAAAKRPTSLPRGAKVVCVDKDSECFGQTGVVENGTDDAAGLQAAFQRGLSREEQQELQQRLQKIVQEQHQALQWHSLGEVASLTGLSPKVLNLMLGTGGTVWCRSTENVREDVGMNLIGVSKPDGVSLCVPAYSWKSGNHAWTFSDLAVEALTHYASKFPSLFTAVQNRADKRDLDATALFPDSEDLEHSFQQMIKYCTRQDFKKLRLVPCKYMALVPTAVREMKDVVDEFAERVKARRQRLHAEGEGASLRVTEPRHVYMAEHLGSRPPQDVYPPAGRGIVVGQRGVYIKPRGLVPCGARGTIIAVYGTGAAQELELLLDEDSFGAVDLCGRAPAMRGLQIPAEAFLPLPPYVDPKSGAVADAADEPVPATASHRRVSPKARSSAAPPQPPLPPEEPPTEARGGREQEAVAPRTVLSASSLSGAPRSSASERWPVSGTTGSAEDTTQRPPPPPPPPTPPPGLAAAASPASSGLPPGLSQSSTRILAKVGLPIGASQAGAGAPAAAAPAAAAAAAPAVAGGSQQRRPPAPPLSGKDLGGPDWHRLFEDLLKLPERRAAMHHRQNRW